MPSSIIPYFVVAVVRQRLLTETRAHLSIWAVQQTPGSLLILKITVWFSTWTLESELRALCFNGPLSCLLLSPLPSAAFSFSFSTPLSSIHSRFVSHVMCMSACLNACTASHGCLVSSEVKSRYKTPMLLELQVMASHHVCSGKQTQILCKRVLVTTEPSSFLLLF